MDPTTLKPQLSSPSPTPKISFDQFAFNVCEEKKILAANNYVEKRWRNVISEIKKRKILQIHLICETRYVLDKFA